MWLLTRVMQMVRRGSGEALTIVYGTTTGTANVFAKSLQKKARKVLPLSSSLKSVKVVNAGEVCVDTLNLLPSSSASASGPFVFIQASYGEGECSDDAKPLFASLAHAHGTILPHLCFAVFGLGNQCAYPERYQRAGRILFSKLSDLGAQPILDFAMGDASLARKDGGSIDEDFEAFSTKLLSALSKKYPLSSSSSSDTSNTTTITATTATTATTTTAVSALKLVRYDADRVSNMSEFVKGIEHNPDAHQPNKNFLNLRLLMDKGAELIECRGFPDMAEAMRSTQLIHLRAADDDDKFEYSAGDHLAILPRNETDLVVRLLRRLKMLDSAPELHVFVKQQTSTSQVGYPAGTSLLEVLSQHVHLSAIPSKLVLEDIAIHHAPIALRDQIVNFVVNYIKRQEEKVLSSSSSSTSSSLSSGMTLSCSSSPSSTKVNTGAKRIVRRPNFVDLLEEFPEIDVPVDHLLEIIPPMPIRYYSIASSPKIDSKAVELCVRVERQKTMMNDSMVHGLASWFLANPYLCMHNERESDRHYVTCQVRRSTFRLPVIDSTSEHSIIMIAAGTGMAPLRGFIQELPRMSQLETALYFGCFHEKSDFLFRSEIQAAVDIGKLKRLATAFSHDGPDLCFVQNRVIEDGEYIFKQLSKNLSVNTNNNSHRAYIYLCGSQAMGRGVHAALLQICIKHGGMEETHARHFLEDMVDKSLYHRDVF